MVLDLVSTQPGFAEGASNDQRPFVFRHDSAWAGQKWFRSDFPTTMPRWLSETYRLPGDNELSSIEADLNPAETYRFHSDNDPTEFQWFFSAASLAIRFLGTLHRTQRKHLRTLILDEDDKAVHNPETHARGLIKFCQENSKLRIERRVGFWHHTFPSRWGAYLYRSWWQDDSFSFSHFMVPMVEWILETSKLPALGMPPGSYTLEFKDCNDCHI
jgi:hypothetical protein